ncbi:hypothetical protein KCU98_g1834, partial [Aureobasidium melanogenum]
MQAGNYIQLILWDSPFRLRMLQPFKCLELKVGFTKRTPHVLWLEFKPPKVKLEKDFCIPAFEACSRLHIMQEQEGQKKKKEREREKEREMSTSKTYSSRDSHVVTHRSTNLPFNCLCMAERTGCPVFS